MRTRRTTPIETAYRKATELDPSELSHQRGLGQTLMAEEKYSVRWRFAEIDGPDAGRRTCICRDGAGYRKLRQPEQEAEDNLVKARQYAPGGLVMYNEAMLYQAQGRNEDAIRVLSDAVTGIKGQPQGSASRAHSLGILYQQLGQLYPEIRRVSGGHLYLPGGAGAAGKKGDPARVC